MFPSSLPSDALAHGLLGAADAVTLVRTGVALPQALSQVFADVPWPQARGAIQDIAYRTMRKLGTSQAMLDLLADKPPAPARLRSLLLCALALMLQEDAPYEPFTLVDQAVEAAAADPALARAKGMVNAVLRRALRERDSLLAQAGKTLPGRWNYPQWWIDTARAAYPEQWEAILMAGNAPPPLTLRVNRRRLAVDDYLARLAQAGVAASRVGADAVKLHKPLPVTQIPGFSEGEVSVQDAAAQLAAPLLGLSDGMRVLDACAAPGGKTGHLLECADVELLALDSDPKRLSRITENLDRLGLKATLRRGDASADDWWDGQPFDRILADVPCTASGIVRRHPDIRWLRRRTDAPHLAETSRAILDNLWRMLKPGGQLLFVTCSVWPQESALQAEAFQSRHAPEAVRLDAPGQLLPLSQDTEDHDGLFYALFQKTAL
ncbi:16S rRNA (cytosine(967)-C(5))-methyltransferase RsmB [Noviherbaspirillum galbum]|uniref:16S rRNA (cytosine(967)-C(5))-methyltransferase n=1 Tax=Noviherbaspirillum galbum TaxID=2709383 RepID=A0A6B3SSU1_9BURK|nr:16S rRNA (cytosine(967)-C(5))-methyltransferase RsmB [Noviherbaspirillum galbum]NEX63837.1 16S rRNA (cytosine(967)-C(5))-methyltransferase RsmB [Noviherbaspirillum galbum]